MAFGNPGWRATHNPGLSYLTPSALRAVHAIPIDFIAKINLGWHDPFYDSAARYEVKEILEAKS
jgi:hypothetical protein